MNIDSVILMTYPDRADLPRMPHVAHLLRHNPSIGLHLCIGEVGDSKQLAWRNCDRLLRDYWKANRDRILGKAIAVLEWDVLVTCPLPELIGDYCAKDIKRMDDHADWCWWPEAKWLRGMTPHGAAPFGVSFWSREALDFIAEPKWDALYQADIFCEVRTATIIATRFQLRSMNLPGVSWKQCDLKHEPGIYHPVKGPYMRVLPTIKRPWEEPPEKEGGVWDSPEADKLMAGIYAKYPPFATINGTAVQRTDHGYYRPAGGWEVRVRKEGDKIVVNEPRGKLKHLDGTELIECTEEEFKTDNQGYV